MKSKQVRSIQVIYMLQVLGTSLSIVTGLNVSHEPTIQEKWTRVQEKVCRRTHACQPVMVALGLSELLFADFPSQLLELQELKSGYDALYKRQLQIMEVRSACNTSL